MDQPPIIPSDDNPEVVLRRYARRLNARWWRWPFLLPYFDLMSDALVWADEVPWTYPRKSELHCALRVLWHYRTGLILGQPRPCVEYWELGRRLFPLWVGFHPSRCKPCRRYTIIYRAGNIAAIRCENELERQIDESG